MGDRYEFLLDCAYCGEMNDVYYADSCGVDTFICKKCKKENRIVMDFKATKIK